MPYYHKDMHVGLVAGKRPEVLSLEKWELGVKEIEEAIKEQKFVSFNWLLGNGNCALCHDFHHNECTACPLNKAGYRCITEDSVYNLAGDAIDTYELACEPYATNSDETTLNLLQEVLPLVRNMRDALKKLVEENG